LGGVVPQTAGIIANSQCSINTGQASAAGSGNTLTLVVPVTFQPACPSPMIQYLNAADAAGYSSEWPQMGTWTLAPPVITSLSPNASQAGTAITILGSNFGAVQGSTVVRFNGTTAGVASNWSATAIRVVVPSGASTGNVTVSSGSVQSNAVPFSVLPPPTITSVVPTQAAPGAAVTITGSGFGALRGSGAVWLGSNYGTVTSWSNTQVVATVGAYSTSGKACIQQGGLWSPCVTFTVPGASITSVFPVSGPPGTLVTISGTGFGATQGQGQVFIGGALATVATWSDTTITATVGAGATNYYASAQPHIRNPRTRNLSRVPSPATGASGTAAVQVLQNGVLSPASTFTVETPHITGINPASGTPGTVVTITGTGFGSTGGSVWLGSASGQVTNWGNTQISAVVATGAVSGVVRVQQNGAWSNALSFTVSGGTAARMVPEILTMLVGDTHTLKAMSSSGAPLTGLSWTTSDAALVSLSADDPPVLTAAAVGHATIKAGGASADITVSAGSPESPGTLPVGTVLWTNAVSGVQEIVPAVPSPDGVADVFAYQDGFLVTAITSDGVTAWSADVSASGGWDQVLPDFQGGLVVCKTDVIPNSIVRLDGKTGQSAATYNASGNSL
jgi:hypothetical protein